MFYKRKRANRSTFNTSLSNYRVLRPFTAASPVRPSTAAWRSSSAARRCVALSGLCSGKDPFSVKQQLLKTWLCGGHGRVSHQASVSASLLANSLPREPVPLSPAFMARESMAERRGYLPCGGIGGSLRGMDPGTDFSVYYCWGEPQAVQRWGGFDQTEAFKLTVCLNQSPTAYPRLHRGLIPSFSFSSLLKSAVIRSGLNVGAHIPP